MYRQRLSAILFMLIGAVLALFLTSADRTSALGGNASVTSRGLGPSTAFTYQGGLQMDGAHVSGEYDFQFGLWDSEAGGTQIGSTLTREDVAVDGGRFSVLLDFGDVFDGSNRYLEIAVRPGNSNGTYTTLSPRQALTAVPYAIHAGSVPWAGVQDVPTGFADNIDGVEYANVIVVAKSGGDYVSIQKALDSISDASDENPYLVWVAPGVYEERVELIPHVTLQGAGEGATILRGSGGDEAPVDGPGSATLVGARIAAVRRLTVESDATDTTKYAVAIWNSGSLTLGHVTATSSGSSNRNYGVYNYYAPSPTMTNVTATAFGGINRNYGVYNYNSAAMMTHVTATAFGGSDTGNYGVYNDNAAPTMINVTASASGSQNANFGVFNQSDSSPTMTNVTATGTDGSDQNYGVYNLGHSSPLIRDSRLEGDKTSVAGGYQPKVVNSQLIGSVGFGVRCYNNYDENLDAHACNP